MSITEDTELKDMVQQMLEKSGLLPKIRAQLRAGVFLALDELGEIKNKFHNEKLSKFMNTKDGLMAIDIIKEFLEYFDLTFAASVFDAEISTGMNYDYNGRHNLLQLLNIKQTIDKDVPVIIELLKCTKSDIEEGHTTEQQRKIESDDKWGVAIPKDYSPANPFSPPTMNVFSRISLKSDLDEMFNLADSDTVDTSNSINKIAQTSYAKSDVLKFNCKRGIDPSLISNEDGDGNIGKHNNPLSSLDDLPPLTVPTSHSDVSFTSHSTKHKQLSEKLKSMLIGDSSDNFLNDISQASSLSDDEKKKYQNRSKGKLLSAIDTSNSQDEESISEIDEILSGSNEDCASNSNNSVGEEIQNKNHISL